jgi:hypothetical protein
MEGISFVSQWDYPTVLAVAEGNDTWTTDENTIELHTANEWVYFIIETTFAKLIPSTCTDTTSGFSLRVRELTMRIL